MKKFIIALLSVCWCSLAGATSLNIPYQNEQPGGVIKSGDWNADMQAIAQWANNNNIDGSTNIATAGVTTSSIANGAVTNAKIDSTGGIFTYGDVYGSSLIQLNNISSSAGEIPTANLGTGTANSSTYLNGNQNWVSPVLGASNISGIIGAPVSKSVTTAYQAATDGYVVAWGNVGVGYIYGETDSNASPSTIRSSGYASSNGYYFGVSFPVRKNDYYEIIVSGLTVTAIYFYPIGS